MTSLYEGIKTIIRLDTTSSMKCEHCSEWVGGVDFSESVTHYIQEHGYKLLHVGSETIDDGDGGPWHMTVVVLGK
jgi:hypothetical protein